MQKKQDNHYTLVKIDMIDLIFLKIFHTKLSIYNIIYFSELTDY